jgi:hypothetical protein
MQWKHIINAGKKGYNVGTTPAAKPIWRVGICHEHHFCVIPRCGQTRCSQLECIVLDHRTVHRGECGREKFCGEPRGRELYHYTIVHPFEYLVSKMLLNMVYMLLLSLVAMLLFRLLLGDPVNDGWRFCGIVILGGTGLSLVVYYVECHWHQRQDNKPA